MRIVPSAAACHLASNHHRELRSVTHQRTEIIHRGGADVRRVHRLRDRETLTFIEECQLTKHVAGPEYRKRRFLPVFG